MTVSDIEWNPPGPGMWRADRGHSVGAMTPIGQQLYGRAQPAALRDLFADLGVMADTLEPGWVNGHYCGRLRPLVGADKVPKRLPPKAVLMVLARLHPEMRRRSRRAARTLAERPWLRTIGEWSSTIRPEWEQRNLDIQDVDLTELDDHALAEHVEHVFAHAQRALHTHFVLHGSDLLPIGALLLFCQERGVSGAEAASLLRGASPSSSEPGRLLAQMREQLDERDPGTGRAPQTVDELRALVPMLDDYLRHRGSRIISGYDIDGLTLDEVPELILAGVLHATAPAAQGHAAAEDGRTVRDRLDPADAEAFDQLLDEARSCMDMRDDNGPILVEWPFGLVRRAVLEAGRRLVAAGALTQPDQSLELTLDEIVELLRGRRKRLDGPSGAERAFERAERSRLEPPATIGDAEPQPPAGVLPPAAERLLGMLAAVLGGLERTDVGDPFAGTGVGRSTFVGVVRRADSAEQAIAELLPGEVLVVPFTTPTYNVVLPLAGALVTAEGGPLSHAAVLARELDLPAVVGVRDALHLTSGTVVEVDPSAGRITPLR